jgi:ABC-type polysaccharide/polyol phosphate transport system ATPase subunit
MPEPVIEFERVGKKFRRSLNAALLYGLADTGRRLLGLKPPERLRRDEFWALHEVSFAAEQGECIGIIGPNGAGKSTLLKLVNRDFFPDSGGLKRRGKVQSLIRLGTGLQPLLTGRENIYVKCAELGLSKRETDTLLDRLVAFAGLEKALDRQVKHYSDGMYARLEFSIATCLPMDILLIDEVLAVGDVAFQMRCLERLDELKRAGATILFVSHSEMNVRQIADRCLLLFDGEALAFGDTDTLFRKYYESIGFINRMLEPLGAIPDSPGDFVGTASIRRLEMAGQGSADAARATTGRPLELAVHYSVDGPVEECALVLQFWNSAGLLMASFDSRLEGGALALTLNGGPLWVEFPCLGLTAGVYRIAGGFQTGGRWLGYGSDLRRLVVYQDDPANHQGLFALSAKLSALP